jgi:hypothetical protein
MRCIIAGRLLSLLMVLLVAGCGPSLRVPAAGPGGDAPAAAVERFLHLVTVPDYLEMGWVFGTDRGPIVRRDPPEEVERRMFAIANILQHERFEIRSEAPVPGRVGNAIQLDVNLIQRGRQYLVPFTAVRGPGDRWFVEQIRLEAITGRP